MCIEWKCHHLRTNGTWDAPAASSPAPPERVPAPAHALVILFRSRWVLFMEGLCMLVWARGNYQYMVIHGWAAERLIE